MTSRVTSTPCRMRETLEPKSVPEILNGIFISYQLTILYKGLGKCVQTPTIFETLFLYNKEVYYFYYYIAVKFTIYTVFTEKRNTQNI